MHGPIGCACPGPLVPCVDDAWFGVAMLAVVAAVDHIQQHLGDNNGP